MPRTDKEIAEYMEYYNSIDRKWALEHLARTEGKTQAEIRGICEKYKSRKEDENVQAKFSDKMKSDVFEMFKDGIPAGKIADKHHITTEQVYGIVSAMRKKAKKAQPEAYPGQIYDEDGSEPEYISHFEAEEPPCDVPIPFETDAETDLPQKYNIAGDRKELNWFEMIDALQATAQVIFGKDVKIIEMFASGTCKTTFVNVVASDKLYSIEVRANG